MKTELTDHLEFITSYASLVEREIRKIALPEKPETLYEPQRYILGSKAKRIRPVLTLMACGICGEEKEEAIPAALAVEMVHNFTLIHDDIMDQADSRRGKPAVHQKWDIPSAILAGDGMLVQALLQLQNLRENIDFRTIQRVFLKSINRVCEGQALDMQFQKRFDVTGREYLQMISGKTAALISASLQLGGICASAAPEKLRQLETLGRMLGLAFQIQDDLLDVVADPEKFGKKRGGDISEGKKTFLMVKTLECCTKSEREWLATLLQKRPLATGNIQKVIELYEKYDVTASAEALLSQYYDKAEASLDLFDASPYKQDLQQLIDYLKNREF